jgi:predicted DsbA family dithiol-disulfide isomerase
VSLGQRLAIDIDFDLVCPWCFIGKRHLDHARDRFADKHPDVVVEATWHSLQLLPDVPAEGTPFAEFHARRLGSAEAVRQRQQQVTAAARAAGLDLDLATIGRMPNTALAHRLLRRVARLGLPQLYEGLLDRLFAAYFQRGEDIGDATTLRRLAAKFGVSADQHADVPADDVPSRHSAAAAGVPRFVFNRRLVLSGARDADTLLAAMEWAMQPAAVGS